MQAPSDAKPKKYEAIDQKEQMQKGYQEQQGMSIRLMLQESLPAKFQVQNTLV
jgi:hypothetical protein